jgi:hypothetical protein
MSKGIPRFAGVENLRPPASVPVATPLDKTFFPRHPVRDGI